MSNKKYSVFFVDDEIIVREGIRNCLPWELSKFVIAGEAQDGEIALSMIQDIKPDILITDIRMPFLDGLELSKIVKKMQPWIKIIILSGHDEFEYAKKAISIGVVDYLLKPFTQEELLGCLERAADQIETEKRKSDEMISLKKQIDLNAELLKDRNLFDLVRNSDFSENTINRASEIGISLIARWYTVILIKISDTSEEGFSILAVKDMVELLNPESVVFSVSSDILAVILKSNSAEITDDEAFSVSEAVRHEILRNYVSLKITIGIGSLAERFTQLAKSYADAEKALQIASQTGTNKIISITDLMQDSSEEFSANFLKLGGDPIVDQLKYALQEEVDSIIESYLKLINDNPFQFSIIGSYLMIEVIMASSRIIEELGGKTEDVFPNMLNRDFVSYAVSSVENFTKETKLMLKKVLEYRDSQMNSRYGDMILRAKRYIDLNYNDQDICLHSVAEEVNVSPNHFSAVFSQECGVSFIEYLTSVRIEMAKKLLSETDMRSTDIAYEVGFSDPHYFSFIFKKNTGTTPKDYRISNSVKKQN